MSPLADHILSGQTQRISSIVPNQWVARLAKITVFATFLLLVAGALVTGNKAALSDPTWPKFVGEWYPKYWVGGLRFEDSHRLVASTVGILTLALAIMLQVKDSRPQIRKLGWGAFILVIAQAIIGGTIIHSKREPVISMLHGMVAQAFFCAVIALAVFTSKRWIYGSSDRVRRPENTAFLKLLLLATGLAYIQVVIGTGVRHTEKVFLPYLITHIAVGTSLFAVIVWLFLRTYHVYREVPELRKAALFLSWFICLQVALGIASIYANRARLEPEMAHLHHIVESTAHLAGGAIILAVLFTTTLRAYRLLDLGLPPISSGQASPAAAVEAAV
jgi:heme a synthase